MSVGHPFILWTLQRTGGTNLARRLMELSSLPKTDHEPFNPGRSYGQVTQKWIDDRDPDALGAAVAGICADGVLIKHCVDVVPWEVTAALARASAHAGYRHIFLYRRSAVDRLLSLYFATQTGVWGRDMDFFVRITGATEIDPAADRGSRRQHIRSVPLPVESLVNHESICTQTLIRAWWMLRLMGSSIKPVAYEDVYRDDVRDSFDTLSGLLGYLGLTTPDIERWVETVIADGAQGTREEYRRFKGVELLAEELKSIPRFLPGRESMAGHELHPFLIDEVFPLDLRQQILDDAVESGSLGAKDIESIIGDAEYFDWEVRRCLLYWVVSSNCAIDREGVARQAGRLLIEATGREVAAAEDRYNLASLKELAGETDAACSAFAELLVDQDLRHLHAGCRFHLGALVLTLGRSDEAAVHLMACLDLVPDHAAAHKLLSELVGREMPQNSPSKRDSSHMENKNG